MSKTFVYIDGFNLYYGAIRGKGFYWLDLQAFGRRLNGNQDVERVIYCTAMSRSSPAYPLKSQRQNAYHLALHAACPAVEILYGKFTKHSKLYPIAGCVALRSCAARVKVWEEKGSDVNLGVRLVHDAHLGRFDQAVVVTGDSDLVEPIRLVVQEVNLPVAVFDPRGPRSKELAKVATAYAGVWPNTLKQSQLSDSIVSNGSEYHKPAEWKVSDAGNVRSFGQVGCPQPGCQASLCRTSI